MFTSSAAYTFILVSTLARGLVVYQELRILLQHDHDRFIVLILDRDCIACYRCNGSHDGITVSDEKSRDFTVTIVNKPKTNRSNI